jgi:hypothetical protein
MLYSARPPEQARIDRGERSRQFFNQKAESTLYNLATGNTGRWGTGCPDRDELRERRVRLQKRRAASNSVVLEGAAGRSV